jgi:hypothetical protein
VESCFTMDVFTMCDLKFGGGGVNLKGAWCTVCLEDCDEKEEVGWVPLRFGTCCWVAFLLAYSFTAWLLVKNRSSPFGGISCRSQNAARTI